VVNPIKIRKVRAYVKEISHFIFGMKAQDTGQRANSKVRGLVISCFFSVFSVVNQVKDIPHKQEFTPKGKELGIYQFFFCSELPFPDTINLPPSNGQSITS